MVNETYINGIMNYEIDAPLNGELKHHHPYISYDTYEIINDLLREFPNHKYVKSLNPNKLPDKDWAVKLLYTLCPNHFIFTPPINQEILVLIA